VPDDRVKVLYIAGFGRSGSTVLGSVLGEIEGFFHGGELNFIWEHNLIKNRLCGCGEPFKKCEVWGAVFERAFGGMDRVDAREMVRLQSSGTRTRHVPLMLSPWGRRTLALRLGKYTARLERLYRGVQESTESRVIVDSSKMPSYGYVLGMSPDIDLYVVHLVRDPRAVAYAWLKDPRLDADERAYMNQVSAIKSSVLWDTWNVSSEALWRDPLGRYMRLRYEDFVVKPRRVVEEILGMLGESAGRLPFVGEHDVELDAGHTVAGNPNRFRSGLVRLRRDDEWVFRMAPQHRELVTLLTIPLLERYGYPVFAGGKVPVG
jgi:Sulfotransferase family